MDACPMTINRIHHSFIRNHPELLEEYADECANANIGKPDPDWKLYEAMEQSGLMICLGVYDSADLIGFATILMHIVPHYSVKVGACESLFVSRKSRSYGGWKMLKDRVKAESTAAGCRSVIISAPLDGSLDKVMQAEGETCTNRVYTVKL